MKKELVGSMSEWSGVLKDFFRQINDGSITLCELKELVEHEGSFDIGWLKPIIIQERRCHKAFFGREFDLVKFEATLRRYGRSKIEEWKELGLEPHFLPRVAMPADAVFPGWRIRLSKYLWERIARKEIYIQDPSDEWVVVEEPLFLGGNTVLIDTRSAPAIPDQIDLSTKFTQMYLNDNLLGPIIEKLRQRHKIKQHDRIPDLSSRYGISPDEWDVFVRPALAFKLGLQPEQVRMERSIEACIIPQLHSRMPRKDDIKTRSNVLLSESDYGDSKWCFVGDFYLRSGEEQAFWHLHWKDLIEGTTSIRPIVVLD